MFRFSAMKYFSVIAPARPLLLAIGACVTVSLPITIALTSCTLVDRASAKKVTSEKITAEKVTKRSNSYASLAPSNTELIYALQAGDKLQAVCDQCDYPPAAKQKAQIGTFASVDLEQLAQIKPDVVFLVDGQEAVADKIARQESLHCRPVVLHNKDTNDISRNLNTIAAYTGHEDAAEPLSNQLLSEIQSIRKATAVKPATKVFFCVWPEPLVTVGRNSYLNDAITVCGGSNIAADIFQAYPQYNAEQLLAAQPEVIILPHEALGRFSMNMKKSPWTSLKAVANRRVYYLPARDCDRLSRPTLRIVSGLYWLAERLHPELAGQLRQQSASKSSDHK
jgi:ABC-type Fe3+-hydroxamate transport system substrate-binding protein